LKTLKFDKLYLKAEFLEKGSQKNIVIGGSREAVGRLISHRKERMDFHRVEALAPSEGSSDSLQIMPEMGN
jgi:hypothetical protein